MRHHLPRSLASLTLVLSADFVSGCGEGEGQDREKTESIDGDATDESTTATEPTQVSGAFLWYCDFTGVAASKAETDMNLGCRLDDNGAKVDLSGYTAKADVITGDDKVDVAMEAEPADSFWHFSRDVKNGDLATRKTNLALTNDKGDSVGNFKRSVSDLVGTALTSVTPDRMFSLSSFASSTLEAASFCDTEGHANVSVMSAGALAVPIGDSIPGEEVSFTGTNAACIKPLRSFVGTQAGKAFTAADLIGPLIAAGPKKADGTPGCYFLVTGDATTSNLLVFEAGATLKLGSLRATAAAYHCK